jgi:hypothetical protein
MFAANTSPAHALAITADSTGYDAGFVDDFWGVQFNSGAGSIKSVTFDITATGRDYFDFDGSEFLNFTHPQPGYGPVLGAMGGLTPLDITVATQPDGFICGVPCLGHPKTLTFTFIPGVFVAGDFFRFSADVDGDSPTAGGFFGQNKGASFDVLMDDGRSLSSPFAKTTDDQSVALIRVSEPTEPTPDVPTPTPVPTPATLPLFASGLLLTAFFVWRRKRCHD